jgi:hypothetical protein
MNEAPLDEGGHYRHWNGTATELRAALLGLAGDGAKHSPDFPKNARSMSTALRRLLPILRQVDITTAKSRSGTASAKVVALRAPKVGKFANFATGAPEKEDQSFQDSDLAEMASGANCTSSGANRAQPVANDLLSVANFSTKANGANGLNGHDNSAFSGASGANTAKNPTSAGAPENNTGLPEQNDRFDLEIEP